MDTKPQVINIKLPLDVANDYIEWARTKCDTSALARITVTGAVRAACAKLVRPDLEAESVSVEEWAARRHAVATTTLTSPQPTARRPVPPAPSPAPAHRR